MYKMKTKLYIPMQVLRWFGINCDSYYKISEFYLLVEFCFFFTCKNKIINNKKIHAKISKSLE